MTHQINKILIVSFQVDDFNELIGIIGFISVEFWVGMKSNDSKSEQS